MRTKLSCPYGHTCETIRQDADGPYLDRCSHYINIKGKDPQSTELIDDWRCAVAWTPVVILEGAQYSRNTVDAVVSLRDNVAAVKNTMKLIASTGS